MVVLHSNFRKIGIGMFDGGLYGMMFMQEFTDYSHKIGSKDVSKTLDKITNIL